MITLEWNKYRSEVYIEETIKDSLKFLKDLKKYFFELKTKGSEGSWIYTRYHLMHNKDFEGTAEILKKEMNDIKSCTKR